MPCALMMSLTLHMNSRVQCCARAFVLGANSATTCIIVCPFACACVRRRRCRRWRLDFIGRSLELAFLQRNARDGMH